MYGAWSVDTHTHAIVLCGILKPLIGLMSILMISLTLMLLSFILVVVLLLLVGIGVFTLILMACYVVVRVVCVV